MRHPARIRRAVPLLLAAMVTIPAGQAARATTNPDVRFAIDVRSAPVACADLTDQYPSCSSIQSSLAAAGEFHAVILAYNFRHFGAASYRIEWPADWNVAGFTSCSALTIGGEISGNTLGAAHAWDSEQYSAGSGGLAIGVLHGFATTPGCISFVPDDPDYPLVVATTLDMDPAVESFGACVGMSAPGDPCAFDSVLVASFTAAPLSGPGPLGVQFQDRSWGSPDAWNWDFGDGTSSSEQHPVHQYAQCGIYDVRLSVSNPGAADDTLASGVIRVLDVSEPAFAADVREGCAPLGVQFTDLSGASSAWLWSFGDGTTSTERNPFHVYQHPGSYTVSLSVTRDCPTVAHSEPGFIDVIAYAPWVPMTCDVASGCAPLTVSFNSQTPATAWLWDFGDGSTSTAADPSHVYEGRGVYDVTLTEWVACGPGQDIRPSTHRFPHLIHSDVTVPAFDLERGAGCVGEPFRFHDLTRGTVLARSWDFGDGTTSTEADPVHVYTSAGLSGEQLVTLTVTTDCGTASTQAYVCVRYPPECCAPVATELQEPVALASPEGVVIRWHVSPSSGFLAYNVLRSRLATGPFVAVNPHPIDDLTGAGVREYEYVDASGAPGVPYFYRVQVILPGGGTSEYAISIAVARPPRPGEYLRFTLGMPAPIPSSGVVTFELGIPHAASAAEVSVVDAAGRRVRVLATGPMAAGPRVLTWDGRDAAGRRAAPGVYFVRLESADGAMTRKVVIAP